MMAMERQPNQAQSAANGTGSKRLLIGLDLGQAEDPTAVAISEITGPASAPIHELRELGRAPLGTPYPVIVETTCNRIRNLTMRGFSCTLVVDATGPGRPVVDLFDERLSCTLVGLTITSGDRHSLDLDRPGRFIARVPKNELISTTVLALESGRIVLDAEHPEAEVFAQELRNVEIQISRAGRETFTHRSGTHDDLVLATACAVWFGANEPPPPPPEFVGYGDNRDKAQQYKRTRR